MTAPSPSQMPGAQPAKDVVAVGSSFPVGTPTNTPPASPPTPTVPAATPEQPDNRPPWEKAGEEFNPERAWNLIQNKTKDLAELKARTDPIVAEREQLRRASMEDNERLQEDLAAAAKREQTWRDQLVRTTAETLANGRFIDTDAALALVGDLSGYATDQGIDRAGLQARFDQLAADKPGLVAQAPPPPGFTPNRAQGQAGTGGAVPLDAQIAAAEKSGNFAQSIALKQQRYHQQTQNRS